jgi:tRNA-specific 2-thiouridylase
MKTVMVGMSGGVDSSVTAALLAQQGYRVIGVYMKNWTEKLTGHDCPWKRDLADARAVAALLDIPFKVFDFEAQYKQRVVDYLVAEYQAGRTPNPDVMCNQEIKFKLFFETALADGADLIATGHYARIASGRLYAGIDAAKDQSYFLYRVTRSALSRTLMPIGDFRKGEVREMAKRFNLPTAAKPDSQGICFVGEVGIKEFLHGRVETRPGDVVDPAGRVIGRHDGACLYTIGQRHGLGIGGGKPLYVTGKDVSANLVFVTNDPSDLQLSADRVELSDLNWIVSKPEGTDRLKVRLRYRADLIGVEIDHDDDRVVLKLDRPERAVSPGQSAVIYRNNEVVGGGIIESSRVAAGV